jgi:hypothetical protein
MSTGEMSGVRFWRLALVFFYTEKEETQRKRDFLREQKNAKLTENGPTSKRGRQEPLRGHDRKLRIFLIFLILPPKAFMPAPL